MQKIIADGLPGKGIGMGKAAIIVFIVLFVAGCQTTVSMPSPETPKSPDVEIQRAPAYYFFTASQLKLKEGDINEAIWMLKQALRAHSDSVFLQLELANLYLVKKEDAKALNLAQAVLSIEKDNLQALMLTGQIYQQRGITDEALAAYEQALALGPTEQNVYLVMGRLYWNRNDLDNAERIFRKMTTALPDSYAAYYFYGKVLSAQGKSQEAEQALLRSLAIESAIEEPLLELLEIYLRRDQLHKASDTYMEIIRRNPANHSAVLGLAELYHRQWQNDLAMDQLRQLALRVKTDDGVIATLFDTYLEKKRYRTAIWAIEGMLNALPDQSDLHYLAAMAHDGLQNNDAALDHMLQVAPKSRFYNNAVVHSALLFHDRGQIDRAIDVVRDALDHVPDHVDYYLYLGSFYEALERFDEAIDTLNAGLDRDSKNARLHFRLGVVLDKMGRKQDSIEAMKQVLALTPDDAEALNYLGYTYADLGINLDEAETLIQTALTLKPDDGYITDSLGWVYFKRGDYQRALEWLYKAVALVPDDPTILEHLGDVYHKMNRNQKALEYYKRSLQKRDNGSRQLKEKIRQLDEQ